MLAWGDFLTVVLTFLIVAACIFLIVKGLNTLHPVSGKKAGPTAGSRFEGSAPGSRKSATC